MGRHCVQALTELVPLHLTLVDGSRHDVMVKLVDLRRGSYAAAGKGESYERALQSFRAEAAFYEQCAPVLEQVAPVVVNITFETTDIYAKRTQPCLLCMSVVASCRPREIGVLPF